ncbi:hypothetical protein V1517DRAFT_332549 [Lipomyces orientalis]|uniref:Uncharacterized protein n=1 Tax=Lipomyces orientalis TaxID=1233043 RepID=A0ACC3TFL4_9ASCO
MATQQQTNGSDLHVLQKNVDPGVSGDLDMRRIAEDAIGPSRRRQLMSIIPPIPKQDDGQLAIAEITETT